MHDDAMPRLPQNLGALDRVIRVGLGIFLFALGFAGVFDPGIEIALRIVALVPLATGAFGWCPIYTLLHLDTRRRHPA